MPYRLLKGPKMKGVPPDVIGVAITVAKIAPALRALFPSPRGPRTEDNPNASMTLSEFLAKASRAANTKARELGWIV